MNAYCNYRCVLHLGAPYTLEITVIFKTMTAKQECFLATAVLICAGAAPSSFFFCWFLASRLVEVCSGVFSPLCGFQEYIRLIGPWCQVNIGSCRFMLAQCYLADGEGQKVSPSEPSLQAGWALVWSSSPVFPVGSAVLPGGCDRGGEGGVPDQADGQRGGGGCSHQPQITLLQQGAHTRSCCAC